MSHRRAFVLLLLATGCARDALPGGVDDGGGRAPDLAVAATPDLAALTCASLPAAVQQHLDTHTACAADADCTVVGTRCGLPGICGAWVTRADLDALERLEATWDDLGCTGVCPPCPRPLGAACIDGRCQPATDEGRPVGAPCSDAVQCRSEGQYRASCQQFPEFTNGYCTLPCAHGFGCPIPGAVCRQLLVGEDWLVTACFRRCDGDAECRTAEGYRCCAVDNGGGGEPGNLCIPAFYCPR